MDAVPLETFLDIVSYFPLPTMISAMGVSREWRALVPTALLLPARRSLLNLYLRVVSSPVFPYTRPWILANLRPFNRQAFLDSVLAQYPYVPEAFRVWILEWPARAVIWRAWPGLPRFDGHSLHADGVQRLEGANWMSFEDSYPEVSALPFNVDTKPEYIPVICVWEQFCGAWAWLIFDRRDGIRDRVYVIQDNCLVEEEDPRFAGIYQDWTAFMESRWRRIEIEAQEALSRGPILPSLESPEVTPVLDRNGVDGFRPQAIRAPPWHTRNDPAVIAKLFSM